MAERLGERLCRDRFRYSNAARDLLLNGSPATAKRPRGRPKGTGKKTAAVPPSEPASSSE